MPGKVFAMKRAVMAVIFTALLGMALPAGPVGAQAMDGSGASFCGKRAEIVRKLGDTYGETRQSIGLSGGRGVIELFASRETGSWTLLFTNPQGVSCLMAAGEHYQAEPAQPVGAPA